MRPYLLSFEFFPPRTQEAQTKLAETISSLANFKPNYFSVTYGAGGSTCTGTIETVLDIKKMTQIEAVPHISCINTNKQKADELLQYYQEQGIKHIVVLRGDIPSGIGIYDGDFLHAADLVSYIRAKTNNYFFIEVAAYPEVHPESASAKIDLYHLQQKINAGADRAITQYFYNVDAYFHFIEASDKLGITVPIIPGIMPITNYQQIAKFSNHCGAEIPRWLRYRLEDYAEDLVSLRKFGEDVVTELCAKLLANSAPGLHFYTLNKTEATKNILDNLSK